ncbi:MAG: AI-2E family transporter [Roseobacter sp.]
MKAASREILECVLPFAAIAVVLLLGLFTLTPFIPALLWSVFMAVALFPVHRELSLRFGGKRGFATAIAVIGLLAVVLLPMLLMLRSVIALLPELAVALLQEGKFSQFGLELPVNTPATWQAVWTGLRDDVEAIRQLIGDEMRTVLSSLVIEGRLIGMFVLEFLLGLIIAAILLQNATILEAMAVKVFRKLGGEKGLLLGRQSVLTIRYTVMGILGSAAVQTAVAAFAYWIVGAAHWPLLAFITFFLGMLQVGPVLIWGPLAAWLFLDDQTGMAIFLALWGLIVVGLSDNLVKAMVVSRGANLPPILVFLGAVGGLLVWGIVGIFLGPVILALCLELILWWLEDEHIVPDELTNTEQEI